MNPADSGQRPKQPSKDQLHDELWQRALRAGQKAGSAQSRPVNQWYWVHTSLIVRPGTSSFARYLARRHDGVRNRLLGGIEVHTGLKDAQAADAYGGAVVAVLRDAGINASWWCRDD